MYGKRLIPKLAYDIHLTTSKQSPQGPVIRVFESTPPRPESRNEVGTYQGTVKYQKGCRGSRGTLFRTCNKYAFWLVNCAANDFAWILVNLCLTFDVPPSVAKTIFRPAITHAVKVPKP